MIETIEDLLDELVKYPMETKIRIVIREEETEPGLHKIDKVKHIKINDALGHLELEF